MFKLRLFQAVLGGLLVVVVCGTALAAERGTPGEAKAMVEQGIKTFEALGPAKAIEAFHAPGSPFKVKDLYIFVIGPDGRVVAQANDPKRVGLEAAKIKDVTGASYGLKLVREATPEGAWVDYLRQDPLSGRVLSKSSWVRRHQGYIFGVGIYKPK